MQVGQVILASAAAAWLKSDCEMFEAQLQTAYRAYRSSLRGRIPDIVVTALIAGEDHRFHQHFGVDFVAIAAAIWRYIWHGQLSGASTINQQLVRVITRRYDRKVERKVREILLASRVSYVVPKGDIPGLYLSIAYFGWRMNGLEQACETLGIGLPSMTTRQAASLVARIKYPQPKSSLPGRAYQIEGRTEYLMKQMTRYTDSEKLPAGAEPDAAIPRY
jgi:membrane peptidoglycan carboxypeptidase